MAKKKCTLIPSDVGGVTPMPVGHNVTMDRDKLIGEALAWALEQDVDAAAAIAGAPRLVDAIVEWTWGVSDGTAPSLIAS
jgi:hypothetical protein